MPISILLADDHQLMREGLRLLLAQQPDMTIVGEAADGLAACDACERCDPDVVVMDINMPVLNGVDATRRISRRCRRSRVIALSVHSDQNYVLEMLRAGASGYLLKNCAVEELAGAIRTVVSGRYYLSPAITGSVLEDFLKDQGEVKTNLGLLTQREREVLQMISEGHTTREIAELLHISAKTVETHRMRLMKKLGLQSVAELTKFALREGLTTLDY